jgi:hypothetical protein
MAKLSSLLMAGAAAYGLYKLSKLSAEERNELVEKGKKLVNENVDTVKSALGRNGSSPDARTAVPGDVTFGG